MIKVINWNNPCRSIKLKFRFSIIPAVFWLVFVFGHCNFFICNIICLSQTYVDYMSRLYEREIKDFFEVAKIKMAGTSKEAKNKFGKTCCPPGCIAVNVMWCMKSKISVIFKLILLFQFAFSATLLLAEYIWQNFFGFLKCFCLVLFFISVSSFPCTGTLLAQISFFHV